MKPETYYYTIQGEHSTYIWKSVFDGNRIIDTCMSDRNGGQADIYYEDAPHPDNCDYNGKDGGYDDWLESFGHEHNDDKMQILTYSELLLEMI